MARAKLSRGIGPSPRELCSWSCRTGSECVRDFLVRNGRTLQSFEVFFKGPRYSEASMIPRGPEYSEAFKILDGPRYPVDR